MLAAFLQYFGVIYGLLLGLLAVATYQNRLDVAKSNANEAESSGCGAKGSRGDMAT